MRKCPAAALIATSPDCADGWGSGGGTMGQGGFPPLLYGEMTGRNDEKTPYRCPHHVVTGLYWRWGSGGGTAGEGIVKGSM
jgi:hypothetical protein